MQRLYRNFQSSLILESAIIILSFIPLGVQHVFFYTVYLLSEVKLSFPDLVLELSNSVFLDFQLEGKPFILILAIILLAMESLYLIALLSSLSL